MHKSITLREVLVLGLSMGVYIALILFQDKNMTLLQYMMHVFLYMYNLVIINKYTFQNHIDIQNDVLFDLKNCGIQVNVVKYNWAHDCVSYLVILVI